MKRLALSAAVVMPLAVLAGPALADCSDLTIASMNWQSAEVLASLDQFILNEGYGCDAEVTVGDTVPAITSLVEKGKPEIVPEAWVDLMPEIVAAGERLRAEAEIAAAGPSLTMRWDALPRSGSGGGAGRIEPGDRALSASARVQAALDACGPRLRAMVEQVCIHGTSLQLAEQALSLRRRQGKTLLKQGLQALADHYGFR